jgi:hypothetical protein
MNSFRGAAVFDVKHVKLSVVHLTHPLKEEKERRRPGGRRHKNENGA